MEHKAQQRAWDREYSAQKLLSPSNIPQSDVVRFFRWLKKERKRAGIPLDMEDMRVLDLGSGTGRNSFYVAVQGATVTGYEFSPRAISIAEHYARSANVTITYTHHDIGSVYPLENSSIDMVLDVTASNSLSEEGRGVYLAEVYRVLKPGGYFFVRALSSEGDPHARKLMKRMPGKDTGTYIHPDLGITERVFSREEFNETYSRYFKILSLDRIQHYARVSGRIYKRSYWVAYLQKEPV